MTRTPAPAQHVALLKPFRFAGTSARSSATPGDLPEILRRRLRLISLVFIALFIVFAVVNGARLYTLNLSATGSALGRTVIIAAVSSLIQGVIVWLLRPSANSSLTFLRGVEATVSEWHMRSSIQCSWSHSACSFQTRVNAVQLLSVRLLPLH